MTNYGFFNYSKMQLIQPCKNKQFSLNTFLGIQNYTTFLADIIEQFKNTYK
jgi:hypothetical protein